MADEHTIAIPRAAPLTTVHQLEGWIIVTYVGGVQCRPVGSPVFDTEAEAAAFIAGAEWERDGG